MRGGALRVAADASKLSASTHSRAGSTIWNIDGVGLRDLAGDRRAVGDDAGDRRDQRFRARAAILSSEARRSRRPCSSSRVSSSCDARDRAARRQRLVAREPALDDGDLLVELALALAHVGDVDRLHGRRDIGQHVALPSPRAEPRKAARRRRQPAADRGLHEAAGVGIGDDAARQLDRAL